MWMHESEYMNQNAWMWMHECECMNVNAWIRIRTIESGCMNLKQLNSDILEGKRLSSMGSIAIVLNLIMLKWGCEWNTMGSCRLSNRIRTANANFHTTNTLVPQKWDPLYICTSQYTRHRIEGELDTCTVRPP